MRHLNSLYTWMSPFRDKTLPFIIYKQKISQTIYYKFLDIHVLKQKTDLRHQYVVKYIIKDHRRKHIGILEAKVYMLKIYSMLGRSFFLYLSC